MKKLFYYLLFPSILFSQTTPSVTPRADGEGSLGTETYRWGEGHFVEAYTEAPSLADDSNMVPTTSWVRDLVGGDFSNINTLLSFYLKKNSYPTGYQIYEGEFIIDSDWEDKILTLDMPDYGNLHSMWALDYDGIIDVIAQDYDPYTSKILLSFKDIFTSSPYTEFVQPVKAPNPTAADDSTNVATTAWVQDEIATKQNASNAMTLDTTQQISGTKIFTGFTPIRFNRSAAYYPFQFFYAGNLQWRWYYTGADILVQHLDSQSNDTTVMQFNYANKQVQFDVSPTVPTVTSSDNSTLAASTAFVQAKASGALLTEATPASSSDTGTKGMIRYDANYVYICTATDTWIRIAKDAW